MADDFNRDNANDFDPTRRSFLRGAAGVVVTAGALAAGRYELVQLRQRVHTDERAKNHRTISPSEDERPYPTAQLRLKLNGSAVQITTPHHRTLLLMLREDMGLTGTKKSCNLGHCGACTVLMDGLPIYSCLTLALDAVGHDITTIEGLEKNGALHPVQQGFIEKMGSQCGHCTSGMIMSGVALLRRMPSPTVDDVKLALSGNLCRCGNYSHEIQGVLAGVTGGAPASRTPSTLNDFGWSGPARAFGVPVQISEEDGSALAGGNITALDAYKKATGRARYAGDVGFHSDDPFQKPLFAKVLRCPFPHATVSGIDDSEARKLPGYRGMITFKDVPDYGHQNERRQSHEPNANDRRFLNSKGRYVGDAVAAVAAEDQYTAQRALSLLKVDFEELRPYPDAEYNLKHGITKIQGQPVAGFGGKHAADYPTVEYKVGDVEQGFRDDH